MSQIQDEKIVLSNLGSLKFTSRPISKHPVVQAIQKHCINSTPSNRHRCWLGWGRKRSGKDAQKKAQQNNESFLLLEDGFIRSIEREDTSVSLVVDDIGIYYDAQTTSRLERLIEQPLTAEETARAEKLISLWKENRVSKYNASPEYKGHLPNEYVLVIDQVAGDSSIEYGLADSNSFQMALNSALAEHPEKTVLVKVHPDAFTRSKYGHFALDELVSNDRIKVINEACHPVELIKNSNHVYVVTSQVGFEALIWGKPVTCFGAPFYAGWGLTDDRGTSVDRRKARDISLQQLVASTLIKYSHYIDPDTGQSCEVEKILRWIGLQRKNRSRIQEYGAPIYAIGFSRWKKPFVRQFLDGSTINFVRNRNRCPENATAVVWGSNEAPSNCKHVLRIEDGFLRSSGLGADLIRPLSWVIDDMGIYYDATRPSRLEKILSEYQWSETELQRADRLRKSIIESKLSKYNLSGSEWKRPKNINEKVLLVPGQVPSDASIKLGCQNIRSNSELLKTVRRHNPDCYIVYKPHPDVVAGLRKKDSDWNELDRLCDEVVLNADGMQMLEQIDEVHTMTSLMGFEALIRNKAVYCYGQPFYSGWGLTHDNIKNTRRNRRLSLQQLCAGTLVQYPTYINTISQMYTTPEKSIQELSTWRNTGPSTIPVWRKILRALLKLSQ